MNEQSLLVIRRGMNASQDGPGNRLVYHLQGCNFRCRWCSNPESIPLQGLTLQTEPPRCSCRAISVAALAKEALAARPLFFGGGGVTFTGGEPTTQFKALKTALELCRANGIHTCLESNASHPRLPELFALIDFLILDCKHYDNQAHLHWTGQGNATVCENLRRAAGEREQLLLRIPLVSGVNAEARDALRFSAHFKTLGVERFPVEILRYHEFGKEKWKQCGWAYTMENPAVSDAAFAAFCAALQGDGIGLTTT